MAKETKYPYIWECYNYKTKFRCGGETYGRDEACEAAETIARKIGVKETVATVTDFMGRTTTWQPSRVSGRRVWK